MSCNYLSGIISQQKQLSKTSKQIDSSGVSKCYVAFLEPTEIFKVIELADVEYFKVLL